MDIFDEAQMRAEAEREALIHRHRQFFGEHLAGHAVSPDGRCADCGEEIEAARRAALPGTPICVDCARDRESRRGEAGR